MRNRFLGLGYVPIQKYSGLISVSAMASPPPKMVTAVRWGLPSHKQPAQPFDEKEEEQAAKSCRNISHAECVLPCRFVAAFLAMSVHRVTGHHHAVVLDLELLRNTTRAGPNGVKSWPSSLEGPQPS